MPNALTNAIAVCSALLALTFFAVLYHVASEQPVPAVPSPPAPVAEAPTAKCAGLSQEQCLATVIRCSWQVTSRTCVRGLTSKTGPRRSKGLGGTLTLKGAGAKGLGAKGLGTKGIALASTADGSRPQFAASTAAATCVELDEAQCLLKAPQCSFDKAAHVCLGGGKRRGRGGRTSAAAQKSVQHA